jgi:hypothetical protein
MPHIPARAASDRSSEDRVAAEEVNLDLHRIAHPAEDVDVIPSLLVVLARWIVVDTNLVVNVAVKIGELLRLEDVVDNRELADLFSLEVLRLVEHLTVTVTEDIG